VLLLVEDSEADLAVAERDAVVSVVETAVIAVVAAVADPVVETRTREASGSP